MSEEIEHIEEQNYSHHPILQDWNDSLSNENYVELDCILCNRLWRWGYPTLLVLGILGNALCFVAFGAHKLRRETWLLCTLLSLFDSFSLISMFATRWPDAAFNISPINMNQFFCHIFIIVNYWLPELAAWTLVLISIERFLSGIKINLI